MEVYRPLEVGYNNCVGVDRVDGYSYTDNHILGKDINILMGVIYP